MDSFDKHEKDLNQFVEYNEKYNKLSIIKKILIFPFMLIWNSILIYQHNKFEKQIKGNN